MQTGTDDSKDRQEQMIEEVDRYRRQQRQKGTDHSRATVDRYRRQQRKTGTDHSRARQEQMRAELDRYRTQMTEEVDRYRCWQRQTGTANGRSRQEQIKAEVNRSRRHIYAIPKWYKYAGGTFLRFRAVKNMSPTYLTKKYTNTYFMTLNDILS